MGLLSSTGKTDFGRPGNVEKKAFLSSSSSQKTYFLGGSGRDDGKQGETLKTVQSQQDLKAGPRLRSCCRDGASLLPLCPPHPPVNLPPPLGPSLATHTSPFSTTTPAPTQPNLQAAPHPSPSSALNTLVLLCMN